MVLTHDCIAHLKVYAEACPSAGDVLDLEFVCTGLVVSLKGVLRFDISHRRALTS